MIIIINQDNHSGLSLLLNQFTHCSPIQLNVRYLAPLLMAYDDRLNEKDAIIEKYEVRMNIDIYD